MWAVRAVIVALLIIVVVAFALNNYGPEQTVDVHLKPLYHNYANVPLVTVVFWSLVSGMILALLLVLTNYIKLSVQMHSAKKRIKALESEVAILRNRPIEESADLLKGADGRDEQTKSAFSSD